MSNAVRQGICSSLKQVKQYFPDCESDIAFFFVLQQLLLTFDPIIVEKVSILLLDMMVVRLIHALHVYSVEVPFLFAAF